MINNDWDEILKNEFDKPYFKRLINYIDNEYELKKILTKNDYIFNYFILFYFN